MLQQRGAKNVKALVGGWNQWVNDGNTVERGDK
jgi:3-mercaptopyruvate sulfurtransferase SseA